jgi:hypothetical protein
VFSGKVYKFLILICIFLLINFLKMIQDEFPEVEKLLKFESNINLLEKQKNETLNKEEFIKKEDSKSKILKKFSSEQQQPCTSTTFFSSCTKKLIEEPYYDIEAAAEMFAAVFPNREPKGIFI